ncbi:MAG: amidophosphoribosyltransferase [Candidatus Omnitrophica bacterium]|nr:amidophosphoribosyltransferase [Candidatus Omnitrophota bacterium]MDD5575095.1 amidophosphoribosyltransferase [Candidatus Omnitrophota bacterium]
MSGLFGVVSTDENCNQTLFYGTDYHSHLGTEYGGLAVLGERFHHKIHAINQTQFKSKFFEDYHQMSGKKGIGAISDADEQPIFTHSRFGSFFIATAGFIENKEDLTRDLLERGISFSELSRTGVNTSELIAKLITMGDNLIDGIESMFEKIRGSCSLLLLHQDGIYAARDRKGYTPLALGKSNNTWAVASETTAFTNLGFETVKFLLPGEIILLDENNGLVSRTPGRPTQQICTFLWIYTGFPASSYENISVELVRERCGQALARQDKDIDADAISGVPDSGVGHAIGYAMESKKPYRRPLVKYTAGYGRSYTPPSQETRDLVAKMKLIPIRSIIEGNRMVVCDDSIVRGTQLKNFAIHKLWDCGAKEVHVRPACPPLLFPCRFCLSTRTTQELAARRAIRALEGRDIDDISEYLTPHSDKYAKMVEWIARDLEVTTLRYLTIDDMVEAIGLPKEQLCLYCWTGQCPAADAPGKKTDEPCRETIKKQN